MQENTCLSWITKIQAIAQNGLTYCTDPFDKERYEQLRALAADMLAESSSYTKTDILALFSKEVGYATPKLDLRAAIFKEDKILLVKERSDDLWTLPGGWAEVNESPSEGVEREAYEETGFMVKTIKLIGLLDKLKHEHPSHYPHTYKALFLCEIIDGVKKTNIEISSIDFFSLDNLPTMSTHRITKQQIALCYEHYKNICLPTVVD